MRISTATRWAEGFGAGAAIALLGLLNKADPSFAHSGFLPQALASVLAAALLGAVPGALSLAGAALGTFALAGISALLDLDLSLPGAAAPSITLPIVLDPQFGMNAADQSEKDKDLSEDDRDQAKEEIQELTKTYEAQATELAKSREKEVMEE